MQPSPLTAPVPQEQPKGPVPAPPPAREPEGPSWSGRLIQLGLLAAIAVGAWWLWQRATAADPAVARAEAELRTHTVASGAVTRTLRISGVTAAEKFVSVIAPQMRASRSGGRREFSASRMETPSLPAIRTTRNTGTRNTASATMGGDSGGSAPDATGGAAAVSSNSGVEGGGGGGGATRGGGGGRASGGTARASSGGSARASSGGARISTGGSSLGSTESQLGAGMGGSSGGGSSSGGGGGSSFSRFGSGGEFALTLQRMSKPGSRVKKGDIVAEFDRQYMLQRLEDYKSSVAQYEANMKKLQAELDLYRVQHAQTIDIAKGELDKSQLDLKTLPVRGNMDRERLQLAYEEAKAQFEQVSNEVKFVDVSTGAQMRNAELDFEQAKLELKRSEANADRMLVKSPIDGITVMQQTFVGSEFRQIQEGDQVFSGQFFMQVVEPGSMVINATVNQVDGEKLRVGAKAKVRFDAFPGLELPAHVVSIAAVTKTGGFRATWLKEIPVVLKLERIDDRVIPDLSVSADVVLEEEPALASSVVAPLEGVFQEGGKSFVWVRTGDAAKPAWTRREVQTGLASFTHTSIRSGLKPGDVVALGTPPQARSNS